LVEKAAAEENDQLPVKGATSLLGRKSLGRRNSLHADRNKTLTNKKNIATLNDVTSQNSGSINKRLSLHDLPKTATSPTQLMPPPRAPFG
jgi:hypothetical protein